MLYKYRPLSDREVAFIREPALFFARPERLNDPLELEAILHIDASVAAISAHLKGYRAEIPRP